MTMAMTDSATDSATDLATIAARISRLSQGQRTVLERRLRAAAAEPAPHRASHDDSPVLSAVAAFDSNADRTSEKTPSLFSYCGDGAARSTCDAHMQLVSQELTEILAKVNLSRLCSYGFGSDKCEEHARN